jgi:hypothetical protein
LFTIGLKYIDPFYGQWTIGLFSELSLEHADESLDAFLTAFYLIEGYSICSCASFVLTYTPVRRFQYVPPIDPIIQRIKSKLRLLLGFMVEFPPQQGDFGR